MDVKVVFFLLTRASIQTLQHSSPSFLLPPSTPMSFFKKNPARIASFEKKIYSNNIDNLAIFRSDVIRKRLWFYIFMMVVWIFLCSVLVHTALWLE